MHQTDKLLGAFDSLSALLQHHVPCLQSCSGSGTILFRAGNLNPARLFQVERLRRVSVDFTDANTEETPRPIAGAITIFPGAGCGSTVKPNARLHANAAVTRIPILNTLFIRSPQRPS